MMKFRILLFLLYIVAIPTVKAQQILPFVENFTKSEYAGDNQVWNVVQGKDNAMYFANNRFLLRYNGVKWEHYTLPNKTIIRSVFIDGETVYTGSYKEFGYWKRIMGKMVYTPISEEKLFEGFAGNEEIWKIFRSGKLLYFQSFNALYVYDGKMIKRISCPSQISYAYPLGGKIYVATTRNGVYELAGNTFKPMQNWAQLKGAIVHGMEREAGITYIFTKNNGVFRGTEAGLAPWQHPLNDIVKSEVILSAKMLDNNRLSIGTSRQGLYIVDFNNGSYININRKNAIKNNAVLSMAFDSENDLWLGLDNGIAHIEINSPVRVFTDNSGVLGSVYSLSSTANGFLLVTNHGIFTYKDNAFTAVPGSQGQVWDVYKHGNAFILGHNDGTFVYNGTTLSRESPVNGGWKFLKSKFDGVYFQANYSGIAVYKDINNLSEYKVLDKILKPIRNIAQNRPGELWAADNYRSLYRITYDENFTVKKVQNISEENNIKSDFGVKIFNFRDQVLFFINNVWYTYNSISGKLEKNPTFNKSFSDISDIIPIDDDSFMIVKAGLLYIVKQQQNAFSWKLLPEKYYQGRLIIENTQVFNDGKRLVVNLDDGFIAFDKNLLHVATPKLKAEAFYEGRLVTDTTAIKYNKSLELNIITPWFGYNRADLTYTFDGNTTSQPIRAGKLMLNNLASGSHDVAVFYNNGSGPQKVLTYSFYVNKPWYFSFYMIVLYIVFTALVFFLYYRWNHIKYLQKVQLNEEEMRHRTQILELEHEAEIKLQQQEYDKHRLEMEVQTKASEVAGKSLSIAKHSEMIESIQEALEAESNAEKLVSRIKKIIRTSSISKNEWQSFEKNLVKSHEEFVSRLTAKYPLLTSKDIKLCIYLKMNLSSKEIAPLMNISFRGVELHRYRLRKKLDIETEESLTRFMISI
jgi:AraC family transcriptional regulator, chitin signaling transcriptional activator